MTAPDEYCFLGWFFQHWSSCMTKSEWSGWMQAVFSVLAIAGAATFPAWLANKDRANKKLAELTMAKVVAASTAHVLAQGIGILESVLTGISEDQGDGGLTFCDFYASRLDDLALPEEDTLLLIAPAWPDVAQSVSLGRSLIYLAADRLRLIERRNSLLEANVLEIAEAVKEMRTAHKLLHWSMDFVIPFTVVNGNIQAVTLP